MSPEIDISVSGTRSKFAFLFSSIAELYRFYYETKPSCKFEDIKISVNKLIEDGYLDDYFQANLERAFNLYPTLLPGVVAANFKKDENKELERLTKLNKFLDILIGDICGEINDRVEEINQYEKDRITEWINKY